MIFALSPFGSEVLDEKPEHVSERTLHDLPQSRRQGIHFGRDGRP